MKICKKCTHPCVIQDEFVSSLEQNWHRVPPWSVRNHVWVPLCLPQGPVWPHQVHRPKDTPAYDFHDAENVDGIAKSSHKNRIYCIMQNATEFAKFWMNKSKVGKYT